MVKGNIKNRMLCGLVIMALVMSCGVNAATIKKDANDQDEANISTSTTMTTINLGTIYCEQRDGTCYVNIELTSTEKYIDLGRSGENIKFTAKYVFILPGSADDAWAQMWYWDGQTSIADKHDDIQQPYEDGTIEVERDCYDGDNFNIYLKGYCSDWYGINHEDNEAIVTIHTKLPVPKLSGSGEIKGTGLKEMSPTSVGQDVQIWNSGDPRSSVAWGYSTDRLYGDWDVFPGSNWFKVEPDGGKLTPEDGKQSIQVWITMPEDVTYVKGSLRVYNTNNPDDYIDIPVSAEKKAKSISNVLFKLPDIFQLIKRDLQFK